MARGTDRAMGTCCAAVALLAAACSTKVRSFEQTGGGDASSATGGGAASATGGGAASATGGGAASATGGGPPCEPGAQQSCYTGSDRTLNRGTCRAGMKTCDAEGTGFGPCAGQILPAPERCDTLEDEDCDGEINNGCVYARCDDLPPGSPDGASALDPDGAGPAPGRLTYCQKTPDGAWWALVHNSVGSQDGSTPRFWEISYADRLGARGTPALDQNFYQGALYLVGREYRDEIADLDGASSDVVRAKVAGFDEDSMRFVDPTHSSGDADTFVFHFLSGWASADFDGDTHDEMNCATTYENVTQHYGYCFTYNLGADADSPHHDDGWGPHLATYIATKFGLTHDPSDYTRVSRISRWTRW